MSHVILADYGENGFAAVMGLMLGAIVCLAFFIGGVVMFCCAEKGKRIDALYFIFGGIGALALAPLVAVFVSKLWK